ncbi:hypothetical protein HBI56_022900 [Parastagonospora nodorum]|nr:hypothetical protein HBH53_084090 [Parastagonospora nodorum]KAH3975810.1 hypothetical protein HBH51_081260 [Parastagonospora nodorum]KAH3984845.1 hypothetical protein HBH52_055210 [Parastagonospora nodorum]KAH4006391.1 hypothetical protein HBI10_027400 [Parastagonospora nodorum]KAH4023144.1 hypothetical protein HBI13_095010 [Parastagonospora nodorum]
MRRTIRASAQSYIPSSLQEHLNTALHNKDRHSSKPHPQHSRSSFKLLTDFLRIPTLQDP